MFIRLSLIALTVTLLASAAAQLQVVASIAPYGYLVSEIAGGEAEVSVMLPTGASPHTFEPTPRDAGRLAEADLVVLNGGSDEWLREMAQAVNPGVEVFEALEVLEGSLHRLEGAEGDEHDDEVDEHVEAASDHDHLHLGVNPHVWLDPVLMAEIAESLAATLARIDPTNADRYRAAAREETEELAALDAELRATLAPLGGAPFIPFHDAWPYFADRYGLDLIMEIEPFPGREPSPRYLASVVRAIRGSGAPAIFNEAGLSDRAATVLANEADVEVYTLDPLGRAEESYPDLMRRNARTLLQALRAWQAP